MRLVTSFTDHLLINPLCDSFLLCDKNYTYSASFDLIALEKTTYSIKF